MWSEIATWQEQLNRRPDLSVKTIALYTRDARRFATWLQQEHLIALREAHAASQELRNLATSPLILSTLVLAYHGATVTDLP